MKTLARQTFCFVLVLILFVSYIQCRSGRGGGRGGGGRSGGRGSNWGGSRGSSWVRVPGSSGKGVVKGRGRAGSLRGSSLGSGIKVKVAGERSGAGSWSQWRSRRTTVLDRTRSPLYSKSLYSGHRKTVNSDGFGIGK